VAPTTILTTNYVQNGPEFIPHHESEPNMPYQTPEVISELSSKTTTAEADSELAPTLLNTQNTGKDYPLPTLFQDPVFHHPIDHNSVSNPDCSPILWCSLLFHHLL